MIFEEQQRQTMTRTCSKLHRFDGVFVKFFFFFYHHYYVQVSLCIRIVNFLIDQVLQLGMSFLKRLTAAFSKKHWRQKIFLFVCFMDIPLSKSQQLFCIRTLMLLFQAHGYLGVVVHNHTMKRLLELVPCFTPAEAGI